MTPVIHCSAGNIHFFPTAIFIQRKEIQLTKHKNYNRSTSSSQRFLLPQSSLCLFPIYRSGFFSKHGSGIRSIAAVGADVTVEEPNPAVSGKDAVETTESTASSVETSESAPTGSNPVLTSAKTKRSRPVRKSEMPPVKDEDLIPGASFTGKVRSVQPFGAFVDFGAFTDGLVHVSRMSDGYVKDVASVVSVGQEVKVRIVEANMETGRISLTMRDSDDARKVQQKRESPATGSSDRPRTARKNAARSTQKRDEEQKKSNFVKGQVLTGMVKNTIRSGSFISLPDGEEGFIPVSEESEGFGNVTGNSSLQVGQEVNVRVLRIARGKVTLTMKKEEDVEELNRQLNKGVWHTATNPFELAFRQNKDIASFLDDRERSQKSPEYISLPKNSEEVEDKVDDTITKSDTLIEDGSTTMEELLEETTSAESSSVSGDEEPVNLPWSFNAVPETLSEDNDSSRTLTESSSDSDLAEVPVVNEAQESSATVDTSLAKDADSVVDEGKEQDTDMKTLEANEDDSLKAPVVDEVTVTDEVKENDLANAIVSEDEASTETLNSLENSDSADPVTVEDSAGEIGDGILSSQVEVPVEADDSQGDTTLVEEKPDTETPAEVENAVTDAVEEIVSNAVVSDDEASTETLDSQENRDSADVRTVSAGEIGDGILTSQGEVPEEAENAQGNATLIEENLEMEMPAEIKNVVTDEVKENDVANAIVSEDDASTATLDSQENTNPADPITVSAGEVGEEISTSQVEVPTLVDEKLETETPAQVENVVASADPNNAKLVTPDASNGQTCNLEEASTLKATISPALVKQLREETGAGMMDCKQALSETGGDIVKAQEFLRKKGLASADKKASRTTAEGRIGSYVHDGRIGVLLEVNCETDFVSRGEIFKQLVEDLAMQVAACPQVHYLVTEDVPKEIVDKEREIEMQKEDLLSKPENIRSKIVDGRIRKRLEQFALLEQPYIKNDKMVVKDWVKQTIATIGENIKVSRFVRYNLGEGLEKKSQDFAAEVAAQTVAKESPAAPKEPPAETKETVEKPPAIAVSAALVKQLREETGAGMMDCKKALTETGGNLEKAQEYLRKKGLSSADKKSSRLAAEGRISAYVHDSRIGCLIEVNSETDFVARNEKFKELVDDLAMQVVACPQVEFVSVEDIPEDIVNKEKEIEMQREDLKSKPENIREKIVEGRISKRLGEIALLEQPFIRNDKVTVKDLVKQTVAALGENIRVRRFVRFTLGETKVDS